MQLVLIKDGCRRLGISCATSSRVSIASRIVVREGPVAAELPSGSAPSRCPEPHCPTVLPLGAIEWQADRALGTTEWHGSQHTRSCQEILCHSAPPSGRQTAHSAPPSGVGVSIRAVARKYCATRRHRVAGRPRTRRHRVAWPSHTGPAPVPRASLPGASQARPRRDARAGGRGRADCQPTKLRRTGLRRRHRPTHEK